MRNLYNLALYFFADSAVGQMQFVSVKAHQMAYPSILALTLEILVAQYTQDAKPNRAY